MISGHNGRYSDDSLEDSLLREDEQLLNEMDEEIGQQNNSSSNGWAGLIGIMNKNLYPPFEMGSVTLI